MRFSYIDRLRYDDEFDDLSYQEGERQYIEHLSTINFDKNQNLLRYFGKSFFHDAKVNTIQFFPQFNKINIDLISENVLEDINIYRTKIGADIISANKFKEKPIIYNCSFSGVSIIKCSVDFSLHNSVMDTEITQYDAKTKLYNITISFWQNQELEISFKNAKVVTDKELIRYYTNNRLSNIPYCDLCKSKLLSKKSISKMITK